MKQKKWNWQSRDWPNFTFDRAKLASLELDFSHQSGILTGSIKHISEDDHSVLIVDMLSDEALKTSEIEGEFLDRDSLQSSIRKNLGLQTPSRKVSAQEAGISEMMVDLYQHFDASLTHQQLFDWHLKNLNNKKHPMTKSNFAQKPQQFHLGTLSLLH